MRNVFTVFMAYAVAVFSIGSSLNGQFASQYPNGQYPPTGGQYPAAGQYPQQPYPQQSYPQQSYPQQTNAQQSYPQNPYGQNQPYPQAGNDGQDGPDLAADRQHGVARISTIQGDVNLRRGDTGELVAAITNTPVTTQDHVQTAPGSLAEIELDYGNVVRLGPNTDVGFADLEYRRYQVQLGAGTVIYRVLRNSNSQAEIDTPSVAVRPGAIGEYRISVLEDNTTQITVRSGQAEIFSPRGSQNVGPGQTTMVRGDPSSPEFQSGFELARDQFDGWSESRDGRLLASQSYRYVSQDVYGADDLDAYGSWVPSQYGQVWEPRPPNADWSPYSNGQWGWTNYYGWTWVDNSPWGWAPYHYGRWFMNGGAGWCWWPGGRGAGFGWSPALVGFFGLGAAIGWAALAPFELFHPWWGRSSYGGFYGRGGFGGGYNNGFRNGNIAGMYRNAAFRGGAMSAGLGRFSGPGQRFSAVGQNQMREASLLHGQLPVSATRGSRQFSDRQAFSNPRFASVANRQFFQHQQPSQGARMSFAGGSNAGRSSNSAQTLNSAQALRGNFGGQGRGVQQNSYSGSGSGPGRSSVSGGWQRFGDPGTGSPNGAGSRQSFSNQSESGWHTFGDAQHSPSSFGPSNGRPSGSPPYGASAYGNGRMYSAPNNNQYRSPSNNPATGPRQSYSAPRGSYNYGGGRSTYSAPAVQQQRYSAPAVQHYSAPQSSSHGGGGSFGGGSPHNNGGGGSSQSGGGGGHSSSSGHHGR